MKKLFVTFAVAFVAFTAAAQKPVELFNGKNLDGWSIYTKSMSDIPNELYSIKGKVLTLSGVFGYVYTNQQYANYKLELEWRWAGEASNSGVFINSQGDNKAWPKGYEVQLKSGNAGYIFNMDGATCDEAKKSGSMKCPMLREGSENSVGKWNKLEITASTEKILVLVNGKRVNEVHNPTQNRGHIGLQSEGEAVEFRNVVLTPITK